MLNCFLSFLSDAIQVGWTLIIALVLCIPLWLGFLFSFINSQTRFKKLGAVLWSVLMALILGIVVLAIFKAHIFDYEILWLAVTPIVCFAAIVPIFLATSAFGRVFKRKKKFHWLVFPISYVISFVLVVMFCVSLIADPFEQYTENNLSKEEMEKSEGYDFEIGLFRGSDYDVSNLQIRGKGDSVYYRVKYDLCPYVLDNKDFIAKYTEPLEKVATPWTLLDKEKSSIAFELRKSMMTYESEWTAVSVLDGYCIGLVINDFQKKKSRHFSFCNADISNVPKAYAMEKMANSLWPARETYTKYSYEQAEKACRESQNYTSE